jgi:NCAIR mutase (PurE)-related protein
VRSLTQVYAQLEAVRRNSSDSTSAPEDYIRNVEAMMKEVPWKLATDEVPKEFEPWKKYATDLRADEMMRIAAGQDGPTHRQMFLRILPAGTDPNAAPNSPLRKASLSGLASWDGLRSRR